MHTFPLPGSNQEAIEESAKKVIQQIRQSGGNLNNSVVIEIIIEDWQDKPVFHTLESENPNLSHDYASGEACA